VGTAFTISWRNVLRNFRRSLITVVSISIGIIALLFLWAFNDGSYNNAIDNYRLRYIGSLQIHKDKFFRRPKLETHISNPAAVTDEVEAIGVDAWTTRLTSFALVAGKDSSTGMNLTGIDPVREGTVSLLDDNIVSGRFIEPTDQYVALLGVRAARKLNAEVGEDIFMLSNDRHGAMTAERFQVVGLVTTGDPTVDEMTVFIPIADAQTMLAMEGRITDVVAQVSERNLDDKIEALHAALEGQGVEVLRWYEISSLVMDAQTLDRAFAWIFLGIVVAIVISGIANAVLVSMMQRTREFGVLLALGMQRATLGAMIALETLILGVIGTILGTVTGLLLVTWMGNIGIDMRKLAEEGAFDAMLAEFAMDPIVYPVVNTDHLVITVGMMLVASLASAIYPVWRSMRLEPVEAIRHV